MAASAPDTSGGPGILGVPTSGASAALAASAPEYNVEHWAGGGQEEQLMRSDKYWNRSQ